MNTDRISLGLLAALALCCAAKAQQLPHPTPMNTWIPDDRIYALHAAEDHDLIYIGGSFTWVGPPVGPAAVIDPVTGEVDLSLPKVVGGRVHAAVPDGEGGWYIGGNFSFVAGVPRRGLARILSDGSVDPDWNPDARSSVVDIAIAGDRMYVAGPSSVGNRPRHGLAAIDLATGVVLEDWIPIATGGDSGTASPVQSIAIVGDVMLVGGSFTELTFQPRNSLGALDLATGAVLPWDPDPRYELGFPRKGVIDVIKVEGDRIYVGGEFGGIGGEVRVGIASFDAGSLELLEWGPIVATISGNNGRIEDIEIVGNTVFVGGRFGMVDGQHRAHVAAVHAETGGLLPFSAAITDTNPHGGPAVQVRALAHLNESLYVGGHFFRVNGQIAPCLVALDAETGELLDWSTHAAGGGGTEVYTIINDGTRVFAGGNFYSVGGAYRSGVAAIRRSTLEAVPFSPIVESMSGSTTRPGLVYSIVRSTDRVYIAGAFQRVNGIARSALAAVDAQTGELIPDFVPQIPGWIESMILHESILYIHGKFTSVNGVPRHNLAALDAETGALISSWTGGVGYCIGCDPTDMSLSPDGEILYVAGRLSGAGNLKPNGEWSWWGRSGFAAFDTATGMLLPWAPATLPGPPVSTGDFILDDGEKVWVGGQFTSFEPVPDERYHRRGVASLDRADAVPSDWSIWIARDVSSPRMYGVAQRGDVLFYSGDFNRIQPGWNGGSFPPHEETIYRPGIAAMTADTPTLLDWGPYGISGSLELTDTSLYVSGDFLSADDNFYPYLAVFEYPTQCLGDLTGDGNIGSADLAMLLGSWGPCPPGPEACPVDLTGDGSVGSADLAVLLGNWGECR